MEVVYKSLDGKYFDTQEECEKHEYRVAFMRKYECVNAIAQWGSIEAIGPDIFDLGFSNWLINTESTKYEDMPINKAIPSILADYFTAMVEWQNNE